MMVKSVEGEGERRTGIARFANAIATAEERGHDVLAVSRHLREEDDRGQEPPRRIDGMVAQTTALLNGGRASSVA